MTNEQVALIVAAIIAAGFGIGSAFNRGPQGISYFLDVAQQTYEWALEVLGKKP